MLREEDHAAARRGAAVLTEQKTAPARRSRYRSGSTISDGKPGDRAYKRSMSRQHSSTRDERVRPQSHHLYCVAWKSTAKCHGRAEPGDRRNIEKFHVASCTF